MNILAHYRFEGNTLDSSGNGNHATIVNAGTYTVDSVTGIMGKGYDFTYDGNSDSSRIDTPLVWSNHPRSAGIWISCFITPSAIASSDSIVYRIFTIKNSTNTTLVTLGIDGSNIRITTGGITSALNFAISVDIKYHIVAYWGEVGSDRICKLYVNGIYIGQHTAIGLASPSLGGLPYIIGSAAPNAGRTFDGIIDEVIIGNGEPSLVDVKRMMLGLRPFYAN